MVAISFIPKHGATPLQVVVCRRLPTGSHQMVMEIGASTPQETFNFNYTLGRLSGRVYEM